jgi:2'-5' RNA ligase
VKKKNLDMKRIFIAVKIEAGETLIKMISSFRDGLKNENIKWIAPDNLHITLAFLGDTQEDKIKAIITILKEICERSVEFEIEIKGTGVFKNIKDPRVIWTGIEPSEKLIQLHHMIRIGLKDTAINIEDRHFKPHLTLGRIRNLTDIRALNTHIAEYQNREIQKVPVSDVILYESILHHSGPVYTPIIKVDLCRLPPAASIKPPDKL